MTNYVKLLSTLISNSICLLMAVLAQWALLSLCCIYMSMVFVLPILVIAVFTTFAFPHLRS